VYSEELPGFERHFWGKKKKIYIYIKKYSNEEMKAGHFSCDDLQGKDKYIEMEM
jgi:hypothetical protein